MRAIFLIIRIGFVSTTLINVYNGTIIQGTCDRPCNSFRTQSLAGRFRGPYFIQINGKRELATTMVAMFLRWIDRRLSNFLNNT